MNSSSLLPNTLIQQSSSPDTYHLRIMATTDLHVSLTGYDYYRDVETESMGLSRTATLIHKARAECVNHLLLDNGDILQGNPLGDYAAAERYWQDKQTGEGVHPLIELMNRLHYDAATVGNHEFNYGLDYLEQCIAGANFPYTNANVYRVQQDRLQEGRMQSPQTLLSPYLLLNRTVMGQHGQTAELRIGIVGVVPPQIMNWDRSHLEGRVYAADMVEAAREAVNHAKQAGADIVVLLAHCGYAEEDSPAIGENAILPLSRIADVDAIIFGHAHKVFPSDEFVGRPGVDLEQGHIHGIPAVEPGVWGSHLGLIDLELFTEQTDEGIRWHVQHGKGHVRALVNPSAEVQGAHSSILSDSLLEDAAKEAHERTLAYIHTPVGQLLQPLHSYSALVQDSAVVQLINAAQTEAAVALLRNTSDAHLPLLSAASPFKTGGRYGPSHYTDIPAGPLHLRHMSDIYSYANTLCIVRLNGDEIREWLEWSAGLYRTIVPGVEGQALIDPAFSPFHFDVISGLHYVIDVSQLPRYDAEGGMLNPHSRRIVQLTYEGQPLEEHMEFAVVTNHYRAYSTRLANPDGQRVIVDAGIENRDVLTEYIRKRSSIAPVADKNWQLVCGIIDDAERSHTKCGADSYSSNEEHIAYDEMSSPRPAGHHSKLVDVGTIVTFESSPQARQALDGQSAITWIGQTDHGFARYHFTLQPYDSSCSSTV
ncbi:bifunctional 2',3'-cyclic-nucleotide 2'-phosphodiesterase/3'-nucleotidase [Paenibacillus kandeliae]|uniref:bifunctional 2',3'-cyclic-nucleotide 2'-phosphodiesterase/3'-nucleotidase n=1 Tax=Paenibacillus kandeliae TaxID=3231269 RepID=UPI00345A52E3